MTVLVTGGAGYIGSHTCVELLKNDYDVVVVDNLCNSSEISLRRVAERTGKAPCFYRCDVRDTAALSDVFRRHEIGCVILKPTEWRKACGFKQGRVKREQLKQQAIDFVKDVYHLQVTDDEADAICIGSAYVASLMAAGEEKNESDE